MPLTARPLLAALLLGAAACRDGAPAPLPSVEPNDNRTAAGRIHADTLTLTLVAQRATWRPEADSGPAIAVYALAADGRPPQIPAPLIRVREGTVLDLTVRNDLPDSVLHFYGLRPRPDRGHDSLDVRPGETQHVTFLAGAPGTYAYWAKPGKHDAGLDVERETLAGAFIIDPAGGSPPDRVMVINLWGEYHDPVYPNALTINGRSWPNTEHLAATVGDTLRWRVINASNRDHPMHLHGFYFTVASRGDAFADTAIAPGQRPTIVTEQMRAGGSMVMTSVPDRPGNWLFHCHIAFHVLPGQATWMTDSAASAHATMSPDAGQHMAGLVMGITVSARPGDADASRTGARRLDLFVNETAPRHRAARGLGYVLQRGATPPARDSAEPAGSTLLLTRGQPTDIVVHNRLAEPTAVHWHGIELESYSDGVAGWSGAPGRVAPMIAPGDSFTAHLTLPRAGTFIYHTHLGDLNQLTSGLYGALIVTEPGQPFDPAHDHVFVLGWDGTDDPPFVLVNGTRMPEPMVLDAGRPHRFRLVAIGVAGGEGFTLRRAGKLVTWRAVAKDGFTLPASQATMRPARQPVSTGETFDFEWRPTPGEYVLAAILDASRPAWHQRIIVR